MFRPRSACLSSAALLCLSSVIASAAPGDVDTSFDCRPSGLPLVLALKPDGNIIIGGTFGYLTGHPSGVLGSTHGMGIISPTGTLVTHMGMAAYYYPDSRPLSITVGADGRSVVGLNSAISPGIGSGSASIHAFRPDGTADPAFTNSANYPVQSLTYLADGRLLAAGYSGAATRISRYLAGGAYDSDLGATPSAGRLNSVLERSTDGAYLAGGSQSGGISVYGNPGAAGINLPGTHAITHMMEDMDGSLLLAGSIQTDVSGTKRPLVRISPAGVILASWTLNAGAEIGQIGIQADGRILIGGNFTAVDDVPRIALARLLRDGGVDTTIDWGLTGSVKNFLHLPDGSLLASGIMEHPGTMTPPGYSGTRYLLKFQNDPGSIQLQADATEVRLLVSGAAPLPGRVSFSATMATPPYFTELPAPVWSGGAWRVSGISLPDDCVVTAMTDAGGGRPTDMVLKRTLARGNVAPDILVKDGSTDLPAGSARVNLGRVPAGWGIRIPVTLASVGALPLEGITITPAEENAAHVQIPSYPSTLAPQATRDLEFYLNVPSEPGPGSAVLRIASNDPDESPYLLTIDYVAGDTADFTLRPSGGSVYGVPPEAAVQPLFGGITLTSVPVAGASFAAIQGTNWTFTAPLRNLPDGAIVTAECGGITYRFVAGYRGGTSMRDLTFTLVGPGAPLLDFSQGIGSFFPSAVLPDGADGSVIFGESFYTTDGVSHLTRLHADGSVDRNFAPRFKVSDGTEVMIRSLHRLPSGGILVTGNFDTVGDPGTPAPHLAVLHADGTTDTSFHGDTDGIVHTAAIQPDGKIVIGGTFTQVDGTARVGLARLHADGSLDGSFVPAIEISESPVVNKVRVMADGAIFAGGRFVVPAPSGGSRSNLVRFLPSGQPDSAFHAAMEEVSDFSFTRDGTLLAGTTTYLSHGYLHRVNATTGTSTAFGPAAGNSLLRCILPQQDGRLLISGNLYIEDSYGIARLMQDGTRDPGFRPSPEFPNQGGTMAMERDGKVIFLVADGRLAGVDIDGAARLENDAVTGEVTEIGPGNRLRWLPGGVLPVADRVTFEAWPAGGSGWTELGEATRTPDGWVLERAALPAQGALRAKAAVSPGSSSYFLYSFFPPLGTASPGMDVLGRAGEPLPDGAELSFGAAGLIQQDQYSAVRVVNAGNSPLTGLTVTFGGADAADFRISRSLPSSLLPKETLEVPIVFRPSVPGTRTAELRITGSDPLRPLHIIHLEGQGTRIFSPRFSGTGAQYPIVDSFDPTVLELGPVILEKAPEPGDAFHAIGSTLPINGRFLGGTATTTGVYQGRTHTFGVRYEDGQNSMLFYLISPVTADANFASGITSYLWGEAIATPPGGADIIASQEFGQVWLQDDGEVGGTYGGPWEPGERACILIQQDGKLLLPGMLDGSYRLLRYLADGTRDTSFAPVFSGGLAARAYQLRDGRILVSGQFSVVEGEPREGLVLLKPNGTVDATFHRPTGGTSRALAQQADGKILVAGATGGVQRLNPDGTADGAFQVTTDSSGPPPVVNAVCVQPDGRILIAGAFTQVNYAWSPRIARLLPDGSVDGTFNADVGYSSSSEIHCMLLQADGGILIGGELYGVGGENLRGMARLYRDGGLDRSFMPRFPDNTVNSISMRADGSLLVTGLYPPVFPSRASGITRLFNEPLVSTVQAIGGHGIFWKRNARSAELMYAGFEIRAEGSADWVPLEDGIRTPYGWSINPATLPLSGEVRVTGRQLSSNRSSALVSEVHRFIRLDLTAVQLWRKRTFGDHNDAGAAANTADPDGDGFNNLTEYALGMDPHRHNGTDSALQWHISPDGGYFSFIPPEGLPVDYSAEWSATLREDDWHPAEDISLPGNDYRVFSVPGHPDGKVFMRLKFITR